MLLFLAALAAAPPPPALEPVRAERQARAMARVLSPARIHLSDSPVSDREAIVRKGVLLDPEAGSRPAVLVEFS